MQQLSVMLQQVTHMLWPNPAITAVAVVQLQQHPHAAHPKLLLL
jgi:hypothetical protein